MFRLVSVNRGITSNLNIHHTALGAISNVESGYLNHGRCWLKRERAGTTWLVVVHIYLLGILQLTRLRYVLFIFAQNSILTSDTFFHGDLQHPRLTPAYDRLFAKRTPANIR